MKKMPFVLKTIVLMLLFPAFSFALPGPEETVSQVASAIQSGNAADVAKHFNAMIDLTLPGYDDSYSKTQAGQILKDFFVQNTVKSFKVTKQGASPDGSRYAIGTLEAGKKAFRVYFIIKTIGGQNLLQQLQVQEGQ